MNNYQLTLLIRHDLDDKSREELLTTLKKSLGEIKKEDLWGNRNLAYPIKHKTSAYYAHFEFAGEPSSIPSLDKNIKLNEDIIRYLLIRV